MQKGNSTKFEFNEIVKYKYPTSLDQTKTAIKILNLYFKNDYKGIVNPCYRLIVIKLLE